MYERNVIAPRLRVATSDQLIDELYSKLLKCFRTAPQPLGTESYSTEKIERTEPKKLQILARSEYETPRDTNSVYSIQMKGLAKVKNQEINPDFVQTSQVIAACSAQVIQRFSTIFRAIQKWVHENLIPKICVFEGVPIRRLERFLNPGVPVRYAGFDLSKYDQSQDDVSLEIECRLLRDFGFADVVDEWRQNHKSTRLVSRGMGFEIPDVLFQRKSGDPSTLIFNTLINLCAIAAAIDVHDDRVLRVAVVGDDSLIAYEGKPPHGVARDIEMLFNFHAKYEYIGGFADFCSHYLIQTADGVRLIPHVFKQIIRYFRPDLRTRGDVSEINRGLSQTFEGIDDYDLVLAC